MAISNPNYVYPYVQCQRLFAMKELLKLHLKSTQHHVYGDKIAHGDFENISNDDDDGNDDNEK